MRIICTASVEDDDSLKFLTEKVKALNGTIKATGHSVYAEYEGDDRNAEQLADLFSKYHFYGISFLP